MDFSLNYIMENGLILFIGKTFKNGKYLQRLEEGNQIGPSVWNIPHATNSVLRIFNFQDQRINHLTIVRSTKAGSAEAYGEINARKFP